MKAKWNIKHPVVGEKTEYKKMNVNNFKQEEMNQENIPRANRQSFKGYKMRLLYRRKRKHGNQLRKRYTK